MKALELTSVKSDLHRYLRRKDSLISFEFSEVVEDISKFTSAIVCDGFSSAFERLPAHNSVPTNHPFIEVADAIVEYHIRLVREAAEREMVRKSLLEAYIHVAGPQYVFGPFGKTRLVHSLRQSGARNFAALVFSLHVFNVICMAIQDELRKAMADVKGFELYMLDVEAICRDIVKDAIRPQADGLTAQWARAVATTIEAQLLHH